MMRSLYSGISGLRNHQTRMDVIGNNIANVNTAGYKTSRVIFQDIFSQNVSAGMANNQLPAGNGGVGGTNPTQIGLGIRLSTVDVIHSRSAFGRTDRETDMMIQGDGFFIVRGPDGDFYTRAGNFDIDSDGFLVTSMGYYVMGYAIELEMGVVDPGRVEIPVRLPGRDAGEPVDVGDFIPENYFRVGDEVPAGLFGPGLPVGAAGTMVTLTEDDLPLPAGGARQVVLGTLITTRPIPAVERQQARDPVFGLVRGQPIAGDENGLSQIRLRANELNLPFPLPEEILEDDDVIALMESGTPLPAAFWTRMALEYPTEEVGLPGFAVGKNGDVSVMIGARKVVVGQIAIAMFSNPPGLEKAGNSLYRETASSGPVVVTEAYMDGAGSIDGGGLEMSNVDLANEFTDMIVTQRGFQANSRIITVSDSLLEELVNLKR